MNSSVISWISQQSPVEVYPNIQCHQTTTGIMDSWNIGCDFINDSGFGKDDDDIIHNYFSPTNVDHNIPHYSIHPHQPSSSNHQNFGTLKNQVMQDVIPMSTRVQPAKKKRIRPPWQTYDHIIAERRRREQLSQLFVALSATVPGLRKMDKSSILEEAIKHMKALQEKVKNLEEKMEKKEMESVVIVKKSQIVVDDEGSFFNYENSSFQLNSLPEIEARICDNQILAKVHCEQHKDALANLISKIESLDMSIVSTNATPFGDVALDITIVAEMEKECIVGVKEVATALRAALIQQTAA